MRQRERDERKRDRADSRDSRENTKRGGGGVGGGGKAERGSGRGDVKTAGGPPFRDLENWDPNKVRGGMLLVVARPSVVGEIYFERLCFFCEGMARVWREHSGLKCRDDLVEIGWLLTRTGMYILGVSYRVLIVFGAWVFTWPYDDEVRRLDLTTPNFIWINPSPSRLCLVVS